jgi:hypothetical protein
MYDDMPYGLGGKKQQPWWLNTLKNPLVASTGLNLLGNVFSALFNRGAKREAERDFRTARSGLEGLLPQLDQGRYDPEVASTYANQAVEAYGRRQGDQIDQSLGLDTGLGQGALANLTLPQMMQNRAQAYDQSAAYNQNLLNMKARIRESLFGEAAGRYRQYT